MYLSKTLQTVANPPQSKPFDENQVKNSAGGYSYSLDKWGLLDRFLILGTEGGSYYAGEHELTTKNIDNLVACVNEDGTRAVNRAVEISHSGRAPKNDQALLLLAVAASSANADTRRYALIELPKVARIGTHLFHFVDFVQQFRGWGRGLKSTIADWYLTMNVDKLAEQVTKYQQRDGFSHRDLLRLSHPKSLEATRNGLFKWVVNKDTDCDLPGRIHGHIQLQAAKTGQLAAELIRTYKLTRESVPTELLNDPRVWEALLDDMPMTAMIRNLGNLSKNGVLVPLSAASKYVVSRLQDVEALHKARIHPIQVLMACRTYAAGHGLRGSGSWSPVPKVIDALNDAFYMCFKNVEPTGKNFYLGLDISGSMWSGSVAGIPGFTPAEASGALALVTAKTESNYYAAGFTSKGSGWQNVSMTPVALSPQQRLNDVLKTTRELSDKMGATDCSLPMLDAIEKNLDIDTFVIYTDSETWHGSIHPVAALEKYRQKVGHRAKLIVVGMIANEFSIADPNDPGMLDVVGFDSATPQIISEFSR